MPASLPMLTMPALGSPAATPRLVCSPIFSVARRLVVDAERTGSGDCAAGEVGICEGGELVSDAREGSSADSGRSGRRGQLRTCA